MNRRQARFKRMESYITLALCADVIIFLAYLIFAGKGIIAWKIVSAIICVGVAAVVLYQLFMSRELLRRRSIWMTLAAACFILCVLFSLLLKFPSPPYVLPQV